MKMEQSQPEEERATPAVSETVTDEFTDQVAAEFTGEHPVPVEPTAELTEQVVLEEERVKDEIEIQIDLLKDSDWVVRREAAITLGKWVMSVAWNPCAMRCATVTGRFGKSRSRGWDRLVLPPSNC
jgi:HEAT repeat protein